MSLRLRRLSIVAVLRFVCECWQGNLGNRRENRWEDGGRRRCCWAGRWARSVCWIRYGCRCGCDGSRVRVTTTTIARLEGRPQGLLVGTSPTMPMVVVRISVAGMRWPPPVEPQMGKHPITNRASLNSSRNGKVLFPGTIEGEKRSE